METHACSLRVESLKAFITHHIVFTGIKYELPTTHPIRLLSPSESKQESIRYPAQLRQFFYLMNHKAQLFPDSDGSLHEWTKESVLKDSFGVTFDAHEAGDIFPRSLDLVALLSPSWANTLKKKEKAAVVVHVCRSSWRRTCPALRLLQPEYLLFFHSLLC